MFTQTTRRKIVIEYTITPQLAYIGVPYVAEVTVDIEGNNDVATSVGGAGAKVFTYTSLKNNIASEVQYNHFLKITTTGDVPFIANIDVTAKLTDDLNVVIDQAVSSPNTISINTTSSSLIYYEATPEISQINYEIYGSPELTVKGQGFTIYNNDNKYKYLNTFLDILSDRDTSWDDDGQFSRGLISANSEGNRTITFVLDNDPLTEYYDRPLLETLYLDSGIALEDVGLLGEIVKNREQIYLGNIYGGNSYEDKKRSKYIEIGDYQEFTGAPAVNEIKSPGDTFVNYFKFLRVARKNDDIYQQGIPQWEEIIEFFTETTVDIKNRSDESLNPWDSKFQYLDADYHKYNRVYSQQSNLISRRDLDFNIKKVSKFDTSVISSKLKSAGEIIDSWTDILQNEVMTVDGKFGAINSLPGFNDEIYVIQDKAFAFLSINPRVQIQGSDGLPMELGTGSVLSDYKYISTDSGTLNKWSVVSSPQGIYYYDALNTSFNAFQSLNLRLRLLFLPTVNGIRPESW